MKVHNDLKELLEAYEKFQAHDHYMAYKKVIDDEINDFIASNSLGKPDNKQSQEFCKHEWRIGNIRHPIGNLRCKKCGFRKWQDD